MNQARAGHKRAIAIGIIFVAGLCLVAYFFLTPDTDPAFDNGVATVVEKNEIETQKTIDDQPDSRFTGRIETNRGGPQKILSRMTGTHY